jgi:glutathione S-transferase
MLIVHHLGHSQSERIVWLCEELGIQYELRRYARRADNRMAPPEYKALHPLGAAPVITDGELVLGESGAIVEYVIAKYGDGRLAVRVDQPNFADYLYWFHFANGSLQPLLLRIRSLEVAAPASAPLAMAKERLELALGFLDQRLASSNYLAGDELTAADIMTVFSLTTMLLFRPTELPPNVRAYVQRIGERPAYQRAMQKADHS